MHNSVWFAGAMRPLYSEVVLRVVRLKRFREAGRGEVLFKHRSLNQRDRDMAYTERRAPGARVSFTTCTQRSLRRKATSARY